MIDKDAIRELIKASFSGDRSAAGRYAAEQRWKGHVKQSNQSKASGSFGSVLGLKAAKQRYGASPKEIIDFFKDEHGFGLGVQDFDKDSATEQAAYGTVQALDDLLSKGFEFPPNIRSVTILAYATSDDGAVEGLGNGRAEVNISAPAIATSASRIFNDELPKGFSVTADFASKGNPPVDVLTQRLGYAITVHEFAHALDVNASPKEAKQGRYWLSDSLDHDGSLSFNDRERIAATLKDTAISGYGATNRQEFVAEAFTGWLLGDKRAEKLVRPWLDLLPTDISKASFSGDRSAAGRYAAEQRWKGHVKDESRSEKLNTNELVELIYEAKSMRDALGLISKELGKDAKPQVSVLDDNEVTHYRGSENTTADIKYMLDWQLNEIPYASWGQGLYITPDEQEAAIYGKPTRLKLDSTAKIIVGEEEWSEGDRWLGITTSEPYQSSKVVDFSKIKYDLSGADLVNLYWASQGYDGAFVQGDEVVLFNGSKLTIDSTDALDKASFGGDRSAAGRYAAEQRWKGHVKGQGSTGGVAGFKAKGVYGLGGDGSIHPKALAKEMASEKPNADSSYKTASADWKSLVCKNIATNMTDVSATEILDVVDGFQHFNKNGSTVIQADHSRSIREIADGTVKKFILGKDGTVIDASKESFVAGRMKSVQPSPTKETLLARYWDNASEGGQIFDSDTPEGQIALKQATVKPLVDAWATTANNAHEISLAIQDTAQKVFKVDALSWDSASHDGEKWNGGQATFSNKDTYKPSSTITEERTKVLSSFLLAQYASTQQYFNYKGIKEVTLFRGMQASPADPDEPERTVNPLKAPVNTEILMRPLSSWSTRLDEAASFAQTLGDDAFGTIVKARIKTKDILAIPYTGVGCREETEVVVIGRPVQGSFRAGYKSWLSEGRNDYEKQVQDWAFGDESGEAP